MRGHASVLGGLNLGAGIASPAEKRARNGPRRARVGRKPLHVCAAQAQRAGPAHKLPGFVKKAERADLRAASFGGAQLQGASLDGAQLQGASLSLAQLQGASLDEARLQGARLNSAKLQGASLSLAQLQGANLYYAQLRATSLVGANLQGAVLNFASLQAASLDLAQFQGASLLGAQLQGAPLQFTNLAATDLSNAFLWRTNLTRGPPVSSVKLPDALNTWLPYWEDRAGVHKWTDETYRNLQRMIESLPPPGPRSRLAAVRIQRLDCSTTDAALASCDPSLTPPPGDVTWRNVLEGARVDDLTYGEKLATVLKALVCSNDQNAIYVLRMFLRTVQDAGLSRIVAAGREAPAVVDFIMSPSCPLSGSLTDDDRAKLAQIKEEIAAAPKPSSAPGSP
jgi:Pentapeptide repeats (8 copies)